MALLVSIIDLPLYTLIEQFNVYGQNQKQSQERNVFFILIINQLFDPKSNVVLALCFNPSKIK